MAITDITCRLKRTGQGLLDVAETLQCQAIETWRALSNTSGSVLDPILAIRHAIILQPGQPVTIDIIYGISETRQQSLALLEKYRDYPIADRIFELAWSHSLVVLRQMNASEDDATLFNSLASAVLYPVRSCAPKARRSAVTGVASPDCGAGQFQAICR
jgi:cellobiose phosphorylase